MAVSQSLAVTQSSQSVEGNYSKVRILWRSTQSGASYNGYTRTAYYYVSINGGSETRYSVTYTLPKSTTKTIVDTTLTIPHRADGTGTVKVRSWMDTNISAGIIEQTKTLTLTTIPRATTPTFSASSVNMGNSVTINLNRASSGFTHKLKYSFGSLSDQTSGLSASTNVGTSATFTPPLTLANQIPNATSGKCTITCETYNGSTLIGTKTATLTLNVPSSVVPTIGNISISEATAGIATKFAAYVQNKSALFVSITASGASGSSISAYETTIQSVVYRVASFTSEIITDSGSVSVTTKVTDSRGRTAQVTNTITVLAYTPPEIAVFSAERITSAGVPSDEGNRLAITMKYSISSVGGRNDRTYNYKYRRSSDENFVSFGSGTAPIEFDSTQLFTSSPTISSDYPYVIRLEISDYFQTVVAEFQLSTAFTIMDFRNTGKGMAIGKVSEKDCLEIKMNTEHTGSVNLVLPNSTISAKFEKTPDGDFLELNSYGNGELSGTVKFKPDGSVIAKNLCPYELSTGVNPPSDYSSVGRIATKVSGTNALNVPVMCGAEITGASLSVFNGLAWSSYSLSGVRCSNDNLKILYFNDGGALSVGQYLCVLTSVTYGGV